jgi:hypothetical protein
MDHRAVRLALGLTIAGASMLTAGIATWLITAIGRVTSGAAARDLRLAALVLLAGGAACGLAMGVAMATAGRARPDAPPGTGPAAGGLMPGSTEAPPAAQPVDGPRSLMNPPPPSPPPPWSQEQWSKEQWSQEQSPQEQSPQEQASGDPGPADRVWWRAAHSPGSGWDDTSEEWLRSLRGPAVQQPPPHSAE